MAALAAALLLALVMTGCSQAQPWMPTSPTSTSTPSATGTSPQPAWHLLRTEVWQLDLTLRDVDGAGTCDAGIGTARRLEMGMDFRDNGEVVMYYERRQWPTDHEADWTGWLAGPGFEGSGLAYVGLPCSGLVSDPAGVPTSLTGTFSPDGSEFTGTEVRRYMTGATGEAVYYLDWRAHK